MINIKEIFIEDNISESVSLWLPGNGDGTDLIGAAEYAAQMRVPMVSVEPKDVKTVWPWFEHLGVKIMPRFIVDGFGGDAMSTLVMNINSVLKQGADGAQIILKLNDLNKFSELISSVRNDLFFNKDLVVGLNLLDIWPNDWKDVFDNITKMFASGVLLILSHDDMEKSDFVGRIYGALDNWNANPDTELHVMLGESYPRAEQVYRLVEKLRPELLDKLKFFVSY